MGSLTADLTLPGVPTFSNSLWAMLLQWVSSRASRSSSLGCPQHSHSVSILDALVLQCRFLRQKRASQLSPLMFLRQEPISTASLIPGNTDHSLAGHSLGGPTRIQQHTASRRTLSGQSLPSRRCSTLATSSSPSRLQAVDEEGCCQEDPAAHTGGGDLNILLLSSEDPRLC